MHSFVSACVHMCLPGCMYTFRDNFSFILQNWWLPLTWKHPNASSSNRCSKPQGEWGRVVIVLSLSSPSANVQFSPRLLSVSVDT